VSFSFIFRHVALILE